MRKIIVISVLLISSYSFAQNGWYWQNPLPTGNDYESVDFYNENIGYAVGWNATVAKTTNSGENWFLLNRPAGTLRIVEVLDSNIVIVAGGSGVFKTINSGFSWQLISTLTNVNDICFINQNIGYLTSPARIYKTTNSGTTWNACYNNPGSYQRITFVNDVTGYVSTDNNYILKTTNEGINWSILPLPFDLPEVFFINENTGYSAGDRKILKTTNGGINWSILLNTSSISSPSISFKSSDTGYISHTQKIYRTFNGGNTWDSVNIGGLTTRISSPKVNICIAVGTGGQIVKTSNTGVNWFCVSSPFGNLGELSSITFPSLNTGFICGGVGNILKTTNSGINWFKLLPNINVVYYEIHFVNNETGFVCGDNRKLIRTTNGGVYWDSIVVNTQSSEIFHVHFLNSVTGFISTYQYVYMTINAGINWSQVLNTGETPGIQTIQFVNQQTGYCLCTRQGFPGVYSKLFKSTNAGFNWSQISNLGNIAVHDFQFVNENLGYFISSGTVKKTTNGGVNWEQVFNGNGNTKTLYFIDENTGYLPGFKTTDSGVTWYNQYVDIASWLLNDISFISPTTGFMVGGYGGTIFKTTDGGGTMIPIGINNISELTPGNFLLNQNYPNPFNPLTKIKFSIPLSRGVTAEGGRGVFVSLIIYDLLGREVATLVNEELKPGTYEADWDGSNYSSGVYFYKIISGDYTETKKMVLMK